MKIYTRITFQMTDAGLDLVDEESYESPENGQISQCKGASAAQTGLATSQSNFYNTLSSDYGTQFANQSNILSSLQSSLAPTVAAGASQFGYSPGQVNSLNSTAVQGTAQSYQNAQRALQNQQATQGGGNAYLPSGVSAQQNAALAASGANQTSSQLLGIQNAGYAQGNANYNNAVSALGGVASQYNPTGYASTATGAGNAAMNSANTIQQINQASSPLSILGGVLGGIGGAVGQGLGAYMGGRSSSGSQGGLQAAQQLAADGGPVSTIPSDTSSLGFIPFV
jgi:hypothetical protein